LRLLAREGDASAFQRLSHIVAPIDDELTHLNLISIAIEVRLIQQFQIVFDD
jgi:hypothetical protein